MRMMRGVFLSIVFLLIAFHAEARRTYTIREGDVPGMIAGKFAPSPEELRRANPSVNFNTLRVGETIVDPRPEPEDLEKAERTISGLKKDLESRIRFGEDQTKSLAASQDLNATLDARIQELQPLADMAERYRRLFWPTVLTLSILLCAVCVVAYYFYRADKSKVEAITRAQKTEKEAKAEVTRLKEHHQQELVRVQGSVRAQLETATREGQVPSPPVRSLHRRR